MPHVRRFGVYEVDLRAKEVRRQGLRVPLQVQPFEVLAVLLERPGELVSRDELRASVWPDSVFVDFDRGLNRAVSKLRRALGDSADHPRFVETLTRRGYRLVVPVEGGPRAPHHDGRQGAFRVVWDSGSVTLAEGDNVIGRQEDAAVFLDSSTVSRHHARIRVAAAVATLEDLGSRNGTFLNGRRLRSPAALSDGDQIQVGSIPLRVRTATSAAATTRNEAT